MITTVTMNPCMDLSVRVENFRPGELNIARENQSSFGGKGINAARMMASLGVPCRAVGLCAADRAPELEGWLRGQGIPCEFTPVPGALRTNIKVMDGEIMTEINGMGFPASAKALQAAEDAAARAARESSLLVLSGSLPQGCGADFYRKLIRRVSGLPVRVVVDASGPPLMEAVKERPFLIKPNLHELKQAFGCPGNSLGEILGTCGRVLSLGVQTVCVSLGEKGALIADRGGESYLAEPLKVEVKTLHGAGDAMVAGLCKAAMEGGDLSELLRAGMAAAAAAISRLPGDPVTLDEFAALREQVKLRRLTP